MFAGSCIGVILLTISLEFLRRAQREYDGFVAGRQQRGHVTLTHDHSGISSNGSSSKQAIDIAAAAQGPVVRRHARVVELLPVHIIRSLLHMLQFAVAYFIMLLAMYYNGIHFYGLVQPYANLLQDISSYASSLAHSWGR